ncbi:hypothetical protein ILUMI_13295 [Ignelater luminosus]|uniref:Cytochrome b5 heme-binding domain-containing protein n=1 Tax=Ignelater luminosus TaxID=2038154 RepID=A0A8K0CY15_IGNLU|nr:hypothetical protein ILUMI_13295 [Ignelater luminosus]
MPPNSDNTKFKSTIGIKHSLHGDTLEKDIDKWFDYKKLVDGAEGLWRIHNRLYDFSDFLKNHPGGQFWLEVTKGTDITEAFELHHISTKPENMLKKLYIRDAKSERSSPYTFNDNGFYRTLKREEAIQKKYRQVFDITNLLPLILPTAMHLFSEQSLCSTLGMWLLIIIIGSCLFCYFAFTDGHYHPDIFVDGDTPRSKEEMDWGISQLGTVCDRYEIEENIFFILVFFGHHALHHLFPTFDIGVLEHLRPVIEKVIDKFNLRIRMIKQSRMFQAYLQQVTREKPNPNPPDSHKELD